MIHLKNVTLKEAKGRYFERQVNKQDMIKKSKLFSSSAQGT